MKNTVNFSQFCDAFLNMGRESQFTYEGKRALFDYLENYEEETGSEVELDVIALCCDFNEYADFEEFEGEYSDIHTFDKLEENTQVIYTGKYQDKNALFIIQNF